MEWTLVNLNLKGEIVLHKYIALYASNMLKNNKTLAAIEIYKKYGAPVIQQV